MKHTWTAGLVLMALGLVGCSTTPTGASITEVSVAGLVGGNNSLMTLNGSPLDLGGANILVDGEAATLADIKPGMEIEGEGRDERGRLKMRNIEGRWRARGMVDEVNTTDSYVDVVGLRAHVNEATRIYRENADDSETAITLADLKAGDHVKVAGLSKEDDSIVATRIELKTEDKPERTGLQLRLRKLDKTAQSFTYGLQTYSVNYKNAKLVGTLAEGEYFRLRGLKDGNTIQAELIKSFAPERRPEGRHVEFKGLVSKLNTTDSTFVVRDHTIHYGRAKVVGKLADEVMVEVKGLISGDKKVDAIKVVVEGSGSDKPQPGPGREGKLEGPISAFDAASKTLKIAEVTVKVSALTKYEIADAHVSAETFWGTNREGQRAQAKGRIVEGGMEAVVVEVE